MKEMDIVQLIQRQHPAAGSVTLGIGDDAAVLQAEPLPQLVCKDMLLDGVHFILAETDPYWVGHKALAVNLSDIAAMGGAARSAYIGLALPRQLAESTFLERLYEGLATLAGNFGVVIAGGDTNIWAGPFVISLTVIGTCHARGAITRYGARAGDVIFVSGPLGDSYASGHHLRFTPRLAFAKSLLDRWKPSSMIDLSDGLGKDLRLIAAQSGLRAALQREAIPLRATLATLPREAGLARALSDGEDFELCFTLSPADARALQESDLGPSCYAIGHMIPGQGLGWADTEGQDIEARGYEHQ